jgi:hypothetical protein
MYANTSANSGTLHHASGGAIDEILRIGWQIRAIAGQLDAPGSLLEVQVIEERYWLNERFQLMKTVGSPAQDVEQQIDFAARVFRDHCNVVRHASGALKDVAE